MSKKKNNAVLDSYKDNTESRMDSWVNLYTGWGRDRNRNATTSFEGFVYLNQQRQEELDRSDWVSRRIIRAPAYDMTSKGVDFFEDDEEVNQKLMDDIENTLDRLGWMNLNRKALIEARKTGGGVLYFTFDDNADIEELKEPVNPNRVNEIVRIDVVNKWYAQPVQWYMDPQGAKFGEPEIYIVSLFHFATSVTLHVHESRLIRFDAPFSSQITRSRNGGWNDSVLVKVYNTVQDFGVTSQSLGGVVQNFITNILKSNKLNELLSKNAITGVMNRIFDLFFKANNENVVAIGEGEEFTKVATPITGLETIWDRKAKEIAGAAEMPLSRFFGGEGGALNGNVMDGDQDKYYDDILAWQEEDLRPPINRWLEILAMVMPFDPEKIRFKFCSLYQMTDNEKAEIYYKTAQADAIYMDRDVLSPMVVAENRFSGQEIDFTSMQVDVDELKKELEEIDAMEVEQAEKEMEALKGGDKPDEQA
jgi:phage-related protein (TIGR01555 family)